MGPLPLDLRFLLQYFLWIVLMNSTMAFVSPILRRRNILPLNRCCLASQLSNLQEQNFTSSSPRFFSSNNYNHHQTARVHLAVGSNLVDRFQNLESALNLLSKDHNIQLLHTSMLHETAPMYVTDQPSFLNGVVEVETSLDPVELLNCLKAVEAQLGRDLQHGIRNGPRPVDLDILFYHNNSGATLQMDTTQLTIPHPRMAEREFVLAPLAEVLASQHNSQFQHPILQQTIPKMLDTLLKEQSNNEPERVVVLPLPRDRMLYLNQTLVMGILNVTPDSFSDGGKYDETNLAVHHALQMEQEGASIIDIGGESTRPGAKEVSIQEEYQRTIPVIEQIRQESDIAISIDTRHSQIARAAIEAGADIVNDVSGGTFDPDMLPTVAELGVPIVLMHMKGTPETMQSLTKDYNNVVEDVASALLERCQAAEAAGIPRWRQVVDPGIGFAKDVDGNLSLLKHLNLIRSKLGMTSTPVLLGTSRKGFIGNIIGAENAQDRDFGTVASCVAALCFGNDTDESKGRDVSNILRVHNVKAMKEAALIMDAIRKAK